MQQFELSVHRVPTINARLTIRHAVDVEIKLDEISASFGPRISAAKISAPVRAPVPRREVQKLFQLIAPHRRRASVKIKRRTPPAHSESKGSIPRRAWQWRVFNYDARIGRGSARQRPR